MRKQVVVVGAGFAGINAVHELRDAPVDITIIDRNNFHTFQPLLYQVATGYLGAEEVGATVRSIFRSQTNVKSILGEVVGVDWETRHLKLSEDHTVYFDYLVLAAGGAANLDFIPGMKQHSHPLYTLDDAVILRKRLISELEASVLNSESPANTTIVVVGGGATGVETAGALSTMAKDLLGKDVQGMKVVLVEAAPNLLGGFNSRGAKAALEGLEHRGVEVRLNTKVAKADSSGIDFQDGSRIDSHTIVWAAGILAEDLGEKFGLTVNEKRGIEVLPTLEIADRPDVFAAGDIAFIKNNPAPQLAPAAIQTGKHAAKQIKRKLNNEPTTSFKFRNKGNMAVIGRGAAVVQLPHNISFSGRLAWLAWLGLHIVYLIGFRNRIKVIVDWGWDYLTARGSNAILLKE